MVVFTFISDYYFLWKKTLMIHVFSVVYLKINSVMRTEFFLCIWTIFSSYKDKTPKIECELIEYNIYSNRDSWGKCLSITYIRTKHSWGKCYQQLISQICCSHAGHVAVRQVPIAVRQVTHADWQVTLAANGDACRHAGHACCHVGHVCRPEYNFCVFARCEYIFILIWPKFQDLIA